MKTSLILAAVCALFASEAYGSQRQDLNFSALSGQLSALSASAQNVTAAMPAPVPARAKTGRYVQVSGYVTLQGNHWLRPNEGLTPIVLTGWGTFRDITGQITSNNAHVTTFATLWVYPNQYVAHTVWPEAIAQFTRNGKPVGSATMTGCVSVSGIASENYVMLSGSGQLTGSIYVVDEN